MEIRVDFTDVQDGFAALPEGNYEGTVFEVEQKVGKTSGKPYLNWQLNLHGEGVEGRRAFFMTSLAPNALWNLKSTLANLGYSKEELETNFNLDVNDLVGRDCTVVIVHEEYQGQTRDKVSALLAPGNASTGDTDLYR